MARHKVTLHLLAWKMGVKRANCSTDTRFFPYLLSDTPGLCGNMGREGVINGISQFACSESLVWNGFWAGTGSSNHIAPERLAKYLLAEITQMLRQNILTLQRTEQW